MDVGSDINGDLVCSVESDPNSLLAVALLSLKILVLVRELFGRIL